MSRTTKVVGFSLPPETHRTLEKLIKSEHKTRSEFFRGLINSYTTMLNKEKESTTSDNRKVLLENEKDIASILQSYWTLQSQSKLNIIVIGLAIVVRKDGKVLIGQRKTKDKHVENLTWVFPGGKLNSLDFEQSIKDEVKGETNFDVDVNTLVACRKHPDSGFYNVQIIALYFYCTSKGENKIEPGGDLSELKWVKPTDVFKYFTTSTCDEVTKFLATIQKGK
jgi:8-oxo-dGTP pyrophosphatase MutT (NUDIX family)